MKLSETIDLVEKAHHGQTDKGGNAYHLHLYAVLNLLPAFVDDDVRHAALLHDILEDTRITAYDLRNYGYSKKTIALVEGMTRDKNTKYMDYINNMATGGDVDLITLKITDLYHNMRPDRQTRATLKLRVRYATASLILIKAIT